MKKGRSKNSIKSIEEKIKAGATVRSSSASERRSYSEIESELWQRELNRLKVKQTMRRGSEDKKAVRISEVTLPGGWSLKEDKQKAYIKHNGRTVYAFAHNWSDKYKYFKCLFNSHGKKVPYSEVFEFESGKKYPHVKGKNWKINDNIRNAIKKLRRDKEFEKLPIKIETNKGFVLRIRG